MNYEWFIIVGALAVGMFFTWERFPTIKYVFWGVFVVATIIKGARYI